MTIMTLSSPAATGVLGHRPNPAPSFFSEPTQIWVADTTSSTVARLVDFGDKLVSIATTDVIELCARYVRDAGAIRISHCVDDDYDLVLVNATAATVIDEEPTAVEAIADLKNRLGVSERAIEDATGIGHTTHNNWKKRPDTQPRAGSEGTLWSLMSAIDDLEAHLGTTKTAAAWLKEDKARLVALRAGRLRRLIDQETGALRTAPEAIVTLEIDERDTTTHAAPTTPTRGHTSTAAWSLNEPTPRIVLD